MWPHYLKWCAIFSGFLSIFSCDLLNFPNNRKVIFTRANGIGTPPMCEIIINLHCTEFYGNQLRTQKARGVGSLLEEPWSFCGP